jgi:hypothetical protein
MHPNMDRFLDAADRYKRPVSGAFEIELNRELYTVNYRVDEADQITYIKIVNQLTDGCILLANLDAEDRARIDSAISRDSAAERNITEDPDND